MALQVVAVAYREVVADTQAAVTYKAVAGGQVVAVDREVAHCRAGIAVTSH